MKEAVRTVVAAAAAGMSVIDCVRVWAAQRVAPARGLGVVVRIVAAGEEEGTAGVKRQQGVVWQQLEEEGNFYPESCLGELGRRTWSESGELTSVEAGSSSVLDRSKLSAYRILSTEDVNSPSYLQHRPIREGLFWSAHPVARVELSNKTHEDNSRTCCRTHEYTEGMMMRFLFFYPNTVSIVQQIMHPSDHGSRPTPRTYKFPRVDITRDSLW